MWGLKMLKDIYVFDCSEPSNCEAFKRLPAFFQQYITDKHCELRNYVYSITKNTKYKPLFTSGFRSYSVNKKIGGVSDSLHLFGLAIDFVLISNFGNSLISATLYKDLLQNINIDSKYQIIFENTHVHLQFNRRK